MSMQNIKTSSFVKKLASNDRKIRDKAFENLKKFISIKTTLTQLDFEKLWKGLFYTMWFSDRPRPQQRLAESLASLFSDPEVLGAQERFPVFVRAFWKVVSNEWPSLDQWRLDKFYMLMRYVIRESFVRLQDNEWDEELVESYVAALQSGILSKEYEIYKNVPMGVVYHIVDIYIDEFEKVVFGDENKEDEGKDDDEEEEVESETESGNEEEEEEMEKKLAEKKAKIASLPMDLILLPFKELQKESLTKTLRLKIRDDLFLDDRLSEWGIDVSEYKKKVYPKSALANAEEIEGDEDEEEDDEEEEEGEDEWTGFGK